MADRRWLWVAVGVFLLTMALRLAHLADQSVWYDEGLSIAQAQTSWSTFFDRVAQSDHPPLHPLLLKLWIGLAGDGEFALRFLSVWWGAIGIAWTIWLGAKVGGSRWGGLAAGLFLALSPFYGRYAQEVRDYTMAVALSAATVAAAWAWFQRPEDRRLAWGYVLAGAAALYTHFFTAPVLLALNLLFVIEFARCRGALPWGRWVAMQGGVMLLFAPWLPAVWEQVERNATYWPGRVSWMRVLGDTALAFCADRVPLPWGWVVVGGMVGLALVGVWALRRDVRGLEGVLLWALFPLAVMLALTWQRPKFAPRYLLPSLPAWSVLIGVGWVTCWDGGRRWKWAVGRVTAVVAAVVAIGGAVVGWRSLYCDVGAFKPDFRAVAGYIDAHCAEGDLVVVVGGYAAVALDYYLDADLPLVPLPSGDLPDVRHPVGFEELAQLNRQIAGHRRLWLVLWQPEVADPLGMVLETLLETYPRLEVGAMFHQVSLLLFDVSAGPILPERPEPQVLHQADFAGEIRLLGYDLDRTVVRPGERLNLTLYWESVAPAAGNYTVFTQVVGPAGEVVAQEDRIAGSDAYPTSLWAIGTVVRQRFMLLLADGTPPGDYALIVGLYRAVEGLPRLPVRDLSTGEESDHVRLCLIHVMGP